MFVPRRPTFASSKSDSKKKNKKDKQRAKDKNKSSKKKRYSSSRSSSKSSGGSSSAQSCGQVFRVASGSNAKSSQEEIIRFSMRKLGRLAAAALQDWDAKTSTGIDPPKYQPDDCPSSARHFLSMVVKPELGGRQAQQTRNLRELEVLGSVIDLLAVGRQGEAADMITQRMLSARMSMMDGGWSRAQYLELTPQDQSAMVPLALQKMAAKEYDAQKKLQESDSSNPDWRRKSEPWKAKKDGKTVEGSAEDGGKGRRWGR